MSSALQLTRCRSSATEGCRARAIFPGDLDRLSAIRRRCVEGVVLAVVAACDLSSLSRVQLVAGSIVIVGALTLIIGAQAMRR